MELRHLRYFVAVGRALHFSRAAERLHLTQPALSRQIRDLEAEVGGTLFWRRGPSITLTREGQQFLVDAEAILAAADQAIERLRRTRDHLQLGHYGDLWLHRYAPGLRAFAKRFPEVILNPVELAPADMPIALCRGEIDFALIGSAPRHLESGLRRQHLEKVPAKLVVNMAHPWAKRRVIDLAELRQGRWAGWSEKIFPGRNLLLVEAAAIYGFIPKFVFQADSAASLLTHVGNTDTVGCVLPFTHHLPTRGLAFVRIKPELIYYPMDVVWRETGDGEGRLMALVKLLLKTERAE